MAGGRAVHEQPPVEGILDPDLGRDDPQGRGCGTREQEPAEQQQVPSRHQPGRHRVGRDRSDERADVEGVQCGRHHWKPSTARQVRVNADHGERHHRRRVPPAGRRRGVEWTEVPRRHVDRELAEQAADCGSHQPRRAQPPLRYRYQVPHDDRLPIGPIPRLAIRILPPERLGSSGITRPRFGASPPETLSGAGRVAVTEPLCTARRSTTHGPGALPHGSVRLLPDRCPAGRRGAVRPSARSSRVPAGGLVRLLRRVERALPRPDRLLDGARLPRRGPRSTQSRTPAVRKLLLGVSLAGNLGVLARLQVLRVLRRQPGRPARARRAAPVTTRPARAAAGRNLLLHLPVDELHHRHLSRASSSRGAACSTSRSSSRFFPQLVAGPIVRARQFLPQLDGPTRADEPPDRHRDLPDPEGPGQEGADRRRPGRLPGRPGLRRPRTYGVVAIAAAVYGFKFQIYNDFSGYSDIAIGTGRLLGYELPINFRSPFKAATIADYWRRWHISMSSWFRDYLFLPLGGSRLGLRRTLAEHPRRPWGWSGCGTVPPGPSCCGVSTTASCCASTRR